MNGTLIFGIIAISLALASFVVLISFFMGRRGKMPSSYRSLMSSQPKRDGGLTGFGQRPPQGAAHGRAPEPSASNPDIKVDDEEELGKGGNPSVKQLLFQAGVFSVEQQQEFARLRVFAGIAGVITVIFGIFKSGGDLLTLLAFIAGGGYMGFKVPFILLGRKIKQRSEETLFYLPLVIEQIAIGVSSSLDIGPCMQRVVQMADERDSHNVVTELLNYVQQYIRTGVSMEDALEEVGKKSGQPELKHAFLALAQVAKHGGEISRQLQELGDSVSAQREARIDAMIKKLELKATGPVVLVFTAFLITLLGTLGLILKNAFS